MKILLHICCAVCAASCVEKLRQEGRQVSGYFYNPNIQPEEEYQKRLKEAKRLAQQQDFPLIAGDYELDIWQAKARGLEKEPEGGRRCGECFRLRLEKTAQEAQEKGFAAFTTTLTVSPHKDAKTINEIGQAIGDDFLARDFKKQDGFKRAQELAKRYNLYHQDYCGCIYSLEKRTEDDRLHQKTCASGSKG